MGGASLPSANHPRPLLLSLSVKLSVRSRAPDGLILLLSDAKQMDFVVLKLAGGRLALSADLGRGPASVTSPVPVSDGQWHTVSPPTCTETCHGCFWTDLADRFR